MATQETSKDRVTSVARKALVAIAAASGLICLCLGAMLVATYLQLRFTDPLNAPELENLRSSFQETGGRQLAEQVRQLDWLSRKAFFTSVRQMRLAGLVLVVTGLFGAVCFAAGGVLGRPAVSVPAEPAPPYERWEASRKGRRFLIWATAFALFAGLAGALLMAPPDWLKPGTGNPSTTVPAEKAEAGGNILLPDTGDTIPHGRAWPGFRGWGGIGIGRATGIPTAWDVPQEENVLWRSELSYPGFSSPIVWADKVFLSSADADTRLVSCYSLSAGEILWEHRVEGIEGSPEESPETTEDTGYAASTPAVCGTAVCAIFANGDLVCLDLDGNRRWAMNLGVPENHYGHSSSLLIDGTTLFVQYDHNAEALLMAFDIASGNMRWDVVREVISWGSPARVQTEDGRKHLVLVDETTVRGYDPADGSLLWREDCLGGEVAPSPAYDGGRVYVANEYAQACGVRIDAKGLSEVLWTWDDALPDVSSPVAVDGRVYLATSPGELICLDGAEGAVVWRREYDRGFYSSPIAIGDRVYLTDLAGETIVFATGGEYKVVGRGVMGEAVYATPAFVDGHILIRGADHLVCIYATE